MCILLLKVIHDLICTSLSGPLFSRGVLCTFPRKHGSHSRYVAMFHDLFCGVMQTMRDLSCRKPDRKVESSTKNLYFGFYCENNNVSLSAVFFRNECETE